MQLNVSASQRGKIPLGGLPCDVVYNHSMPTPMTDTDRLATPADMADVIKRLATILREIETLPEAVQQRLWEDVQIPIDDIRIDPIAGLLTTTSVFSILATMCGPRLNEMVNGEAKQYYETLVAQMEKVIQRKHPWDAILDRKLEEAQGVITASVTLAFAGSLGNGTIARVENDDQLLIFKRDRGNQEHYFASKDILMLSFATPEA